MENIEDPEFVHQRHKSPCRLPEDCDLVLACPQMRSNVNLSRIARVAGCAGVKKMIIEGNSKIDAKIARDAARSLELERRRTLLPSLKLASEKGYQLVGLEQTTHSKWIFDHAFQPKTVLLIGHERLGIIPEQLAILDATVEIPVFGLPHSFNAATATSIAVYEYCRQFHSVNATGN